MAVVAKRLAVATKVHHKVNFILVGHEDKGHLYSILIYSIVTPILFDSSYPPVLDRCIIRGQHLPVTSPPRSSIPLPCPARGTPAPLEGWTSWTR